MRVLSRVFSGALLLALVFSLLGGVVFAQEPSDAATDQYGVAVRLQNIGAYDLAAEQWSKFITDYKNDPRIDRAYHYRGICYLNSKKLDEALKSFQTVVSNYPNSKILEPAGLYLGVAQYNLGQSGKAEMFDAAAQTFKKLAADYPNGKHLAKAIFYQGECLYARDKKEEAARMYDRFLEKFPSDQLAAEALYALGVTREELSQYAAAGKAYDAFLAKHAQSPLATEVGMRKGETLFAEGKYAEAAGRFAAAAAAQGFAMADHATIRQAASLSRLKKYAEAAALYASLPGKFPQSALIPEANLAGGKCYYLAADYASARKLLEGVIKAGGPGAPEAAHWTAKSLLRENRPSEALAVAVAALPKAAGSKFLPQLLMDRADATYEVPQSRGDSIALYAALAKQHPQHPSAPQALYMAGFAALGEGDYRAANKYAAEFLATHADSNLVVDVTCVAAESNLQLQNFAEAQKLFSQLLQKSPSHADVDTWRVRHGLSLHLQKMHKETIAVLQPLLARIKTPVALAEAQYLIGSSQAELGEFAAAVKSLEASLAAEPKWRQADDTLLVLAHCYNRLGNVKKARATVTRLIAHFPQSRLLDRAHYRLGEYTFADGDFPAAALEYQKVIDDWPQSSLIPHALYGLGWAKLSRNDYQGAETVLSTLVQKYPQHKLIPRTRYARGMARQQLGKIAPAVEDIQALLAANPTAEEKADGRYVLGLCQVDLKQYAEATKTFQTLLADEPDYGGADRVLYELAWALKSQDKGKEAAEKFAKLAKDHAHSKLAPESQYHVGEFEYNSEKFNKAAVAYYAAMKSAGKTALGEKATHKLAWAYHRIGDPTNAQQTFNYQRATWPDGKLAADATFMEAECLGKQEKFKEALALYEQVKDPSGKDFEVLALLHGGQAAAQLKQWQKSLALLTKCTKQFPDTPHLPEALYEQGWAQQNLGKLGEAMALYKLVTAKTRREVAARAWFMIGEIQFQQKKHSEAIGSFFKASYSYGYPKWQAAAHYEAGRCFEVLGKTPQAIAQYEELVKKYPESDKVPLAKKRLAELK